jgi:hypothetical protein
LESKENAYTKIKCFDEIDGFTRGLQSFPRTLKAFMESQLPKKKCISF